MGQLVSSVLYSIINSMSKNHNGNYFTVKQHTNIESHIDMLNKGANLHNLKT